MAKHSEGGPKRVRVAQTPAFGRLLKRLRIKRFGTKSNTQQVVTYLKDNEQVHMSRPALEGYERGWNASVDPVWLAGLARAYRIPVDYLIAVLAANRATPELSDMDVERILRNARRQHHGEAATAARFAEVKQRLGVISLELAAFANENTDPTADFNAGRQTAKARGGATDDAAHH